MKTMKFLFFAGLFVVWAFLVALFNVGFNAIEKNTIQNLVSEKNRYNLTNQDLILDLNEVAKHKSASDCWMIINNKVYDITPYMNSHPGGEKELLKGCGIDATSLYNTKDGSGSGHSSSANSMLDAYYIGNLNQKISFLDMQNKTMSIKNMTIPKSEKEDDEEYKND